MHGNRNEKEAGASCGSKRDGEYRREYRKRKDHHGQRRGMEGDRKFHLYRGRKAAACGSDDCPGSAAGAACPSCCRALSRRICKGCPGERQIQLPQTELCRRMEGAARRTARGASRGASGSTSGDRSRDTVQTDGGSHSERSGRCRSGWRHGGRPRFLSNGSCVVKSADGEGGSAGICDLDRRRIDEYL